jgi:membrane AbrB-like protein
VFIGLSVRRETLAALGTHWPAVVSVAIATLLLSVGAGLVLGRHRDVSAVTGVLAMIAGGATGLVAVAHDLGADERVVVVTQYLRVVLVVLSMPLIVTYGFAAPNHTVPAVESPEAVAPWWLSLGFMVAAMIVGTGAAMLIRLPVPAMLGPLAASATGELTGWTHNIHIPAVVLPLAFLVIGWQAGLSFTRDSGAALGRIFGWALLLMVVLTAACGGFGVLLSAWTGISVLEGYLATTPGGLPAVLAVAASTDSDATFVAASQVLRLVLMLLAAPLLVWAITRRHRPQQPPP